MSRPMRIRNRLMEQEATETLLLNNNIASLAMIGDEGKPYVIPIHYIYENGALYFHSAKQGYKIDALKRDNRVGLTVVGNARVINEAFTTAYESVVIEGRAEFVEDLDLRLHIAQEMIRRWTGSLDARGQASIDKTISRTAIIRVCIDSMTGKAYYG